ncbi:hypothetical protein LARI1_G002855 [Lachnellula arida]|uniref:Zn(2)-C6 fungal-type domain-containing protein n=1 Tax=Lachnellula arida TaxID=1316785 RepID=A0A8T9BH11_9HELO|nr:hypothetical protein LARI1_G002855 [Lachnellula arida]
MGNRLSWLSRPQSLSSFYPSCPTTVNLETVLVISASAQDKVARNTQYSAKGASELQYPTPRSVPPTKSDDTQFSSWWEFCGNENKSNERTGPDEPESQYARVDESRINPKHTLKTSACDQCYRFKVKCTREPDCCQRCSTNGNACTYSAAIETERSRKRQAPGSPRESSAKKLALTSPSKPFQMEQGKLTSHSNTSRSNHSDRETFCPRDTVAGDTVSVQTSTLNHKSKGRLQTSALESEYQASLALHEQANTTGDSLPVYDSFHYYSDRLLPDLSSQTSDFLFESDSEALDANFAFDNNETAIQQQGSELSSKSVPLEPAFKHSAPTTCGCLQSTTLTLSTLHNIVLSNSTSSYDSILAAARSGLSECRRLASAECNFCQPSSTSSLIVMCVAILQHVYRLYELLDHTSRVAADTSDKMENKIALSIKFGDMEFADIGHDPSIIRVILKMEKMRAQAVCVELEKMVAVDSSGEGEVHGAGKDDKMIRDGLITLLGIYRERFAAEDKR